MLDKTWWRDNFDIDRVWFTSTINSVAQLSKSTGTRGSATRATATPKQLGNHAGVKELGGVPIGATEDWSEPGVYVEVSRGTWTGKFLNESGKCSNIELRNMVRDLKAISQNWDGFSQWTPIPTRFIEISSTFTQANRKALDDNDWISLEDVLDRVHTMLANFRVFQLKEQTESNFQKALHNIGNSVDLTSIPRTKIKDLFTLAKYSTEVATAINYFESITRRASWDKESGYPILRYRQDYIEKHRGSIPQNIHDLFYLQPLTCWTTFRELFDHSDSDTLATFLSQIGLPTFQTGLPVNPKENN